MTRRAKQAVVNPRLLEDEARLQAALIKAAKLFGWRVYHTRDSRGSEAGLPDLILVRPPYLLFWEVKSARGRLRPEQRDWLEALARVELVDARVIRPADFDAAVEVLTGEASRRARQEIGRLARQDAQELFGDVLGDERKGEAA